MSNSSDKTYKVTMTQQVGPGRTEIVQARNPVEARQFAESRCGSNFTARGCNQVYN